jgi:uncharacterized RDD family membrane protein YckC
MTYALHQPREADTNALMAPHVFRRLAAFLYEGVLLFGVLMIAGFVYSALTQMRHGLQGQTGLQLFLFLVLGIYFGWFWSHGGQTVAMKAWHIRLVDLNGQVVGQRRALVRYLLAWMWFVPGLLTCHLLDIKSGGGYFTVLTAGVLGYASLCRLHPERQFWHDVLCQTRLVTWRPSETKPTVSA